MAGITLEDWEVGQLCPEDGLAFCGRCKPSAYPTVVYTTSGGSAFHGDRKCSALRAGQKKVAAMGNSPSEISTVHRGEAISRGMHPCLHCLKDIEATG
jgi:hypothetical protein|tara:strand:- start:64 stop:357 length:294 start_codon:yes stop_codon:yes gene_type:complete